jgi:hypothetical protein
MVTGEPESSISHTTSDDDSRADGDAHRCAIPQQALSKVEEF